MVAQGAVLAENLSGHKATFDRAEIGLWTCVEPEETRRPRTLGMAIECRQAPPRNISGIGLDPEFDMLRADQASPKSRHQAAIGSAQIDEIGLEFLAGPGPGRTHLLTRQLPAEPIAAKPVRLHRSSEGSAGPLVDLPEIGDVGVVTPAQDIPNMGNPVIETSGFSKIDGPPLQELGTRQLGGCGTGQCQHRQQDTNRQPSQTHRSHAAIVRPGIATFKLLAL